jgi:hypothetical protein
VYLSFGSADSEVHTNQQRNIPPERYVAFNHYHDLTTNKEIANNVRQHLLWMINLWSNKESQVFYPTVELFLMWFDLYHPNDEIFKIAFDATEQKLIISFGDKLNCVCNRFEEIPSPLEELIKTPEWTELNKLAIIIMKKINQNAT